MNNINTSGVETAFRDTGKSILTVCHLNGEFKYNSHAFVVDCGAPAVVCSKRVNNTESRTTLIIIIIFFCQIDTFVVSSSMNTARVTYTYYKSGPGCGQVYLLWRRKITAEKIEWKNFFTQHTGGQSGFRTAAADNNHNIIIIRRIE